MRGTDASGFCHSSGRDTADQKWLLGYSEYADAAKYAVALFFIGMGLNVVTDYPLGILKKVPFKWHRLVELTSPPLFIEIPWYFFSDAGAMP
jgi:hypothetical protein